jgi:hypothetical protein
MWKPSKLFDMIECDRTHEMVLYLLLINYTTAMPHLFYRIALHEHDD